MSIWFPHKWTTSIEATNKNVGNRCRKIWCEVKLFSLCDWLLNFQKCSPNTWLIFFSLTEQTMCFGALGSCGGVRDLCCLVQEQRSTLSKCVKWHSLCQFRKNVHLEGRSNLHFRIRTTRSNYLAVSFNQIFPYWQKEKHIPPNQSHSMQQFSM